MTGEQLEAAWRLAREPVAAVVVGVWAVLGLLVAAFIVRFRTDWREGVKAGVALVAASVALVLLVVWQAEQEPPEYFWDVRRVVAYPDAVRGKPLIVMGHVGCGSTIRQQGSNSYRFAIQGLEGQVDAVLEARYTGLIADSLKAGNLIVARGKLAADGVLDLVEDGITANNCGYAPSPRYCVP
jgi:cytochrome c-type biogenesis protein CcmE